MSYSRIAADVLILSIPLFLLLPIFSSLWAAVLVARRQPYNILLICLAFFLLWSSTIADYAAIAFGIGIPFVLFARLTVEAKSWKFGVILRVTSFFLVVLLLPAITARSQSSFIALVACYLPVILVPGQAVKGVNPRLLTALVLSSPAIALAASLPAPNYLMEWIRFPEVVDIFIGSAQIAVVILLIWLIAFSFTKWLRPRAYAAPAIIAIAAMLLLFTKFEPFGWLAMIVAGVSGFLWFRRGPVPRPLLHQPAITVLACTFLFPLITGLLERRFTESPFVRYNVMALVNSLASVPLGALIALLLAKHHKPEAQREDVQMGHLTGRESSKPRRIEASGPGGSVDEVALAVPLSKVHLARALFLAVTTNAVVWYMGAWGFGLGAAGYLDSTGRFANSMAYHGFLTASLRLPVFIGVALSLLTLSAQLLFLPDRRQFIGSDYHGVSDSEMRVVKFSSTLGALTWAVVAALMAREYAPNLLVAGVFLGAGIGSLAGMLGATASHFLLRRHANHFWKDAFYILVGTLFVWFAIHRVLAEVARHGT